MARYFFDLHDIRNCLLRPDVEGTELASFEDAKREARETLAIIFRDTLAGGEGEAIDLVVVVRAEHDFEHFRASVTFHQEIVPLTRRPA